VTTPALQTARLVLRPLQRADREAIVAGINDLEVSRWLARVPFPYGLADADWFLDYLAGGAERAWGIFDADGPAGVVGLGEEFGYWLARSHWGRGHATEAGRAVLGAHFSDPEAGPVAAGHVADNAPSVRVLAKLGFAHAGPRVIRCRALNRDMASRTMVLTPDAWQRLSNPRRSSIG